MQSDKAPGTNGRKSRTIVLQFCWLGLLLAVWQLAGDMGRGSSVLYPTPIQVARALWNDISSGIIFIDLAWSLSRASVGFTVGALLGIVLGVGTARSRTLDNTIGLVIDIVRPIPPIALVPLFILWFGLGELPKYGLVVAGVLPPVWISTHLGLRAVSNDYIWTAQSLGVTRWSLIWEVMLPAATPAILAGLRTAMGIAFYTLVAAEMAGALYGVAYRIELSNLYLRVDHMIGYLAALGLLFVSSQIAFKALSNSLFPWLHLDSGQYGN